MSVRKAKNSKSAYVKMISVIAVLSAICFVMPVLTSCDGNGKGNSEAISGGVSDNSSDTPSGVPEEPSAGIFVSVGENSFEIAARNTDAAGTKGVVLYDREYAIDGKTNLTVAKSAENMYIVIRASRTAAAVTYSVMHIYKPGEAPSEIMIPYNGIVLSLTPETVAEDFKPTLRSDISVKGYTDAPDYERTDLCTVMSDDKDTVRRVNMLLPDSGITADGKIYYAKSTQTFTVPENSVALLIKEASSSRVTVTGTAAAGDSVKDTDALIFTGKYNSEFCMKYFAGEKLTLLGKNMLNDITDSASVLVGDKRYIFENINTEAVADGCYLYTCDNASLVTGKNASCTDIVVVNGSVVYKTENNSTLIPTSHGYVLRFTGEAKSEAADIRVGDSVSSLLIDDSENPDMFFTVVSGGVRFELFGVNTALADDKRVVCFMKSYGETTGTPNGTAEVTVVDGVATRVSTDGNSPIPENGIVIAALRTATKAYAAIKGISADDGSADRVNVSFAGNDYGFTGFEYTAVNGVRYENYTVIYDGSEGKTTGTNIYGYEFAVNADGMITADSYGGNMTIPEGGFVVSAHGKGVASLKAAYLPGSTCTYDKNNKTVSVLKTPEIHQNSLKISFDSMKASLDEAKKQFLSLDYKAIESDFASVSDTYAKCVSLVSSGNIDSAVLLAYDTASRIDSFGYRLYESAPVENRSVWYRCNEKSDAEVYKTVKLMAEMNINAVYLETWYNGQVIGYSEDSRITHNTAANGNYDALEGFCRICHEYGIEVHIWVENFFIGTTASELSQATVGHHLIDKYGNDGCPTMYGYFCFLDPYDSYSRELVMGVYREILEKYDIDGVHLDYIRFPEANSESHSDFGYNDDIISAFMNQYPAAKNPKQMDETDSFWDEWCVFRENIINEWVAEVYGTVQSIKPGLPITCAVSNDYPKCKTTIFQNFKNWVDAGYIDEVFSMSYCSDLVTPGNNIKTFMRYTGSDCFYSIGLSAFETSPDYILVGQVDVARKSGAFGSNLFSWGSLITHEENYFDALKSGIWSAPAVRADKTDKAVNAYAERLKSDIDSVYAYLCPLDGGFYDSIRVKADELLALSETAGKSEADYIGSALSKLEELITAAEGCPDKNVGSAIKSDAAFIEKCLETSLNRLEAAK